MSGTDAFDEKIISDTTDSAEEKATVSGAADAAAEGITSDPSVTVNRNACDAQDGAEGKTTAPDAINQNATDTRDATEEKTSVSDTADEAADKAAEKTASASSDAAKEKVGLSGVPETMLQTVRARALETLTRGAIRDEKAVELIGRLDYDFSAADRDKAMRSGVVARTIVLDRLVSDFLRAHPDAVVVNIACGLDTRCDRMSGYRHWYNLDLPETIAVRAALLPEEGRISQIAMSATEDWGGEIREESAPTLVIMEGLTMYLTETEVQRIFEVISARFPEVTVLAEVMNPTVARHFREKSIESSHARFTWGVRDGRTLAALLPDFRYKEEHSLTEGMAVFAPVYRVLDKIPFVRNISNRIVVLEKENQDQKA